MDGRQAGFSPGSRVRGLFTFALLISFALISLLIVLLGIRVYETIEQRIAVTHGGRTTLMYLAGKTRAADPGSVSIAEYEGGPVIVITESHENERYNTYIYRSGESLCEYFGSSGREFDPSFGQSVLPAASFEAEWARPGLMRVTVDGQTLHLYMPGGGDGG